MNLPAEFPAVLRALLEAELAAGNEVVEIGGGFPAPPVGAYVKLARLVSTRPRESGGGLDFYERNMPGHSGEFTDARRFFFILEPPLPPPAPPDMDAIRARMNHAASPPPLPESLPRERRERPTGRVESFRRSMSIGYEEWKEGIGYDLELLSSATPQEKVEIEEMLLARPVEDWRDVEALAALGTPRAHVVLRRALKSRDHRVTTAVARYAPALISNDERTALLVAALEQAEPYGGLTQTLMQVEEYHPPEVIDALLRGLVRRDGGTAVHFAAMLMFLHGKAESSFDWNQRPFFLRFHSDDGAERRKAYLELCEKIEVTPEAE